MPRTAIPLPFLFLAAALALLAATAFTSSLLGLPPAQVGVLTRTAAPPGDASGDASATGTLERYLKTVRSLNPRLSEERAGYLAEQLLSASEKHGLDARLVTALVACESNFNERAVSPAGARGLGQLMPATAAELGLTDPFDVEQNLEGATHLLHSHLDRLSRRHGRSRPTARELHLALACYNAGPGAVRKHGGVPPYRETQRYVRKVTRLYYRLASRGGLPPRRQAVRRCEEGPEAARRRAAARRSRD